MSVFNFGSLNIDHIYHVDHFVTPGETIVASSSSCAPGGKGLNQSIALAKSGIPTFHIGCIGSDGGMLLDLLREAGVKTNFLKNVSQHNGHAIIQVDASGQNSIVICEGSNQAITVDQVDQTMRYIGPEDMVLLQNEISQVSYIANCCGEKNIPLAFNPSPFTPDILKCFPLQKVSYLFINENEGNQITGYSEPQKTADWLMKRYPDMRVVLTLGSNGVYYADAHQTISQKAFSVSAVDTTGAGDTFTGFFLGLVLQGKSIEEALQYACAAAAISVTKIGAAVSIPTTKEVEAFLKKQ